MTNQYDIMKFIRNEWKIACRLLTEELLKGEFDGSYANFIMGKKCMMRKFVALILNISEDEAEEELNKSEVL